MRFRPESTTAFRIRIAVRWSGRYRRCMLLGKRLEAPDLITPTLYGVVTPPDHADVIAWIRAAITRVGSVTLRSAHLS
jgi:hypothetical protein